MVDKTPKFTMSFASECGAIYIYNRGRTSQPNVVKKTIEAPKFDAVYIDYDKEGRIFGIEILDGEKISLNDVFKLFGEL